jgi:hypothetical protein
MLPNPDTASNDGPRERVLISLSPKEQAIFLFVEHLIQVEKNFQPKQGQTLSITWNYGRTTQYLYEESLKGNTFLLPVPRAGHYEAFSWVVGYTFDPENRKKFTSYEKYIKAYPSFGSSDIRIIDRGTDIVFNANLGSLKGTESWWEAATKEIEYPILVEDHSGTVIYKNPAYEAIKRE